MSTKVTLRQKPISGNRQSLYLDFYPPIKDQETGKETRRKFLNMFLSGEIEYSWEKYIDKDGKEQRRLVKVLDKKGNPKKIKLSPIDSKHNDDTLRIAKQITANHQNALDKAEIYTDHEKELLKSKKLGEASFIEYFKKLTDKRQGSTNEAWTVTLKYLEDFTGGNIRFGEVNEKFCNDFKEYLLSDKSARGNRKKIVQNTAASYFSKFKASLRQAYKDGMMQIDLNAKIPNIKTEETKSEFLTLDEVNKLIETPCENDVIKRAFIFSVYTGMRFSDVSKLTWGEVTATTGQGYFVAFKQQKTKGIENLPISEEAFNLLGERKESTMRPFEGLSYSAYHNKYLSKWIGLAGITRDITFHVARHTNATLQLTAGVDLYTVSKMLGHKDLKTTMRYAKIIDQKKRDAANRINLNIKKWK